MKYEYKKQEKDIYQPKAKPTLINVPKAGYICIKGEGNPNNEDFGNRVAALYSVAYAIKMMPKKGIIPENYFEYTVYPLEGLWDLSLKGREKFDKDELIYTIMIKQPAFVDESLFNKGVQLARKNNDLLDEVYFDYIEDGLSVQMLHVGSYDNENVSFDLMKEFIKNNDLEIKSLVHREIYLSDARRVSSDKLKTILRYTVKEIK